MKSPRVTCSQHVPGAILVLLALASVAHSTPTTLTNGVPITGLQDLLVGHESFFVLDVPVYSTLLEIRTFGGTGDVDLYVRWNEPPTVTVWDYRPYLIGSYETVSIPDPADGPWYIMLRVYVDYRDVTLVATYSPPVPAPAALLLAGLGAGLAACLRRRVLR